MDTRKIFEYALSREYEGKRFFEENAKRLNEAAAVEAFQQLAGEEQKHIDFIQYQIAALDAGQTGSIDPGTQLEQAGFFRSEHNRKSSTRRWLKRWCLTCPCYAWHF